MAKTDFTSVEQYITAQPVAAQRILERVRRTILVAVPGVEEVISYRMPTYKLRGEAILYFAGWKRHYSLYPATGRVLAAFQDDLVPYEVKHSTIRFPLSQPVPEKLIGQIAKFRAKEVVAREKAGKAASKTRPVAQS
jgi:uncharacterized protein YdhG (YjbR/CyaY superfamily)